MSVSINISVGWPKPKNFTAQSYFKGSNQYVKLNWDAINVNSSPFTIDTSGNGILNIKYRIIESYLYKELKYEKINLNSISTCNTCKC